MTATAHLVLVGDELLEGRRVDTNGPWMARALARRGIGVTSIRSVPDDPPAIARAVTLAAVEADVVIVSGGLGPTDDDRTREGLALATGRPLRESPDARAAVEAAYARRRIEPTRHGLRQAQAPEGARIVVNGAGTAPALVLAVGGTPVFALPAVPREVRWLIDGPVGDHLEELPGRAPTSMGSVWTTGLAEQAVMERLADLETTCGVRLGLYPSEGEVEVHVAAPGTDGSERVASALAEVRRRLGLVVLPVGRVEQSVVALLAAGGLVLTTAESMTGGLVARMLTDVPGASAVFAGGWVTYSDVWKMRALGVAEAVLRSDGAVSEAAARAMAEGALDRSGADLAVAVTGVAGPEDGRTPGGATVPAGTFHVAMAAADGTVLHGERYAPLDRPTVRRRAAVAALDLVRRHLEAGAGNRVP